MVVNLECLHHIHIYLDLNCVKNTDINDGIGLLAIKGVVAFERGIYSTSFPISISISFWIVYKT